MSKSAPSNSSTGAARERMRASAHPAFAKNILEPLFELNAELYFHPLIAAHRAWLTMLAEKKIVANDAAAKILKTLDQLEKEGPDSVRPFDPAVEFYYLHMERALVERTPGGEAAVGNLNLGRTRPEPLARIVMRDALLRILAHIQQLRKTLIDRAEAEAETVMPGYTHLLHAQPTTLGHFLLAVQDHFQRDTQRLLAAYATADQCTLGCGAMSGTSLPVDRERVRELLGFAKLCENTIDSVSAADHTTEFAAAITNVMSIIGRVCQDLYVWSSQEYAMIDVTDSFASPSSLMPQKKNALVLEYVRSRTAHCVGHLAASFAVLHNVGYMDTEEVEIESIRPLYDAIELTEESLPTMNALLAAMEPNRELMRKRAAEGFSSVTALAEAIQTETKLSYRTAHRIVARAVLLAVEQNKDATGIDVPLLNQAAKEMNQKPLNLSGKRIADCLNPTSFVNHHAVTGGPAPKEVRRMIKDRRAALNIDAKQIAARRETLTRADKILRAAAAKITSA